MLEQWRKRLLWVAAAALAVFGVLAFGLPEWAASDFPWKVAPSLAMTIGGWALGTAGVAALAARASRLDRILGMNVYLWLFGALQSLVVIAFLDKLQTGHILAWPYLIGLGALLASAAVGITDWVRRRPDLRGPAGMVPRWMPGTAVALGGFTVLLAVGAFISGPAGQLATGRFFPEELSGFSMRAFAAFFASVSGGTLSLLLARNARPYLELDKAGLLLVLPITIASLVYLHRFDFVGRPGGLVYLAAYVVALVLFVVIWLFARTRQDLLAADPGD
jgi:hypothetical protein